MTRIWTPPNRSKPIDVADLSDEVPGPDARYQTHGPGCGCGSMECPWYRGEAVTRAYRSATEDQRRQWAQDVWDSFRNPSGWVAKQLASLHEARSRPGRRWWRR